MALLYGGRFIQLDEVYGQIAFLDLVNGGIATMHEEEIYDMMFEGVEWASTEQVRNYTKSQLYICKNFNDSLRFTCTGDFLDEDDARFPTEEEQERDCSY